MNKFNLSLAILHWILYPLFMFPVILNAESWFYGIKFNGIDAILIHFAIAISGIILGYFILKQKKIAYFAGIVLFVIVVGDFVINRLTA